MRGGELLVGSGYIFKKPSRPHSVHGARPLKDVVAIGIKLDRYHHDR